MKCEIINELAKLQGKRVLLAGGTGFIGKRTAEILTEYGLYVDILTRKERENTEHIRYITCDLNDRNTLSSIIPDVPYDCAIYMAANIPLAGSKKETYYEAKCSTLDPFIHFCDAFLQKASRLIYISSIDTLGAVKQFNYTEEEESKVPTPYGLAKYCGEFYAKCMASQYGIPYLIYRFSQVYGPNEPIVRIIPILINALKQESEFNLFTTGNEKRRFLYVDDAVQAVLLGLISTESGIFNIAGEEVISINDLIDLLEKVYDKKLNLNRLNKMEGNDSVPSIDKAKRVLGYKPQVSMLEGLRRVREKDEL